MARCVFQIIRTLIIHLWLATLIASNTPDPVCMPSIMVPRNTVWKAYVQYPLTINCTVVFGSHCLNEEMVTWCKIDDTNACKALKHSNHTTTGWSIIDESKRMKFLKFNNISVQDAGLYRCEIKSPTPTVSHAINVSVTEHVPDYNPENKAVSQVNSTTNSSKPSVDNGEGLPSYIYICSGIGVLVVVVVSVIVIIVIRCRGQRRSIKEKIHENQSTASPVADLVPAMYNPRESPRNKAQTLPAQLSPPPPVIYDTPPARVTSLRDRSSAGRHPVIREPPRRCHDRGTVEEKEEENPLIYATLNHTAGPQRPARVAHVQIEASEYAAIKVT